MTIGAGVCATSVRRRRRVEERLEIERICDHGQVPSWVTWPGFSRAIAIQFDAIAIRIAEVEGLAHSMIGGAIQVNSRIHETPQGVRQRLAIGIADRDMVQAGAAARWR